MTEVKIYETTFTIWMVNKRWRGENVSWWLLWSRNPTHKISVCLASRVGWGKNDSEESSDTYRKEKLYPDDNPESASYRKFLWPKLHFFLSISLWNVPCTPLAPVPRRGVGQNIKRSTLKYRSTVEKPTSFSRDQMDFPSQLSGPFSTTAGSCTTSL